MGNLIKTDQSPMDFVETKVNDTSNSGKINHVPTIAPLESITGMMIPKE